MLPLQAAALGLILRRDFGKKMGQKWSEEQQQHEHHGKRASSDGGGHPEFRMPYILQATLGKGKNGVVYMAELTTKETASAESSSGSCRNNIVVKTVPLSHKKKRAKQQIVALRSEIDALVSVGQQENLVKYFGWNILAQDEDTEQHAAFFRIFMEYCEGGTLQQRARKGLRYSQLRDCIQQVLHGLVHLHSLGIVHGDLTTTSIFLTSRSTLHLKIGGFGQLLPSPNNHVYNAPETQKNKLQLKLDPKSDIWNVALVLIDLLHEGEREEFSGTEEILRLIGGSLNSVIMWFLGTDVLLGSTHLAYFAHNRKVIECINFLKSCLQKDPATRPSAGALLTTPHIAGNLDEKEVCLEEDLLARFTLTHQMSEWMFQAVDNSTAEKVILTKRVVELANWMDEFVAIATVVAFHGDLNSTYHPQMLTRSNSWACREQPTSASFVEKMTVYSCWDYKEPCVLLENVIANSDGGFQEERVQNYTNQLIAMLRPIWQGIHSCPLGGSVVVLDLCTAYLLLNQQRTKLIMLPFLFPEVIVDEAMKDWFIAANIWDLGILVLTMLTGNVLLESREAGSFSPVIPDGVDVEVKDFLRRCFSCFTPMEGSTSWIREAGHLNWTTDQLISHAFLNSA